MTRSSSIPPDLPPDSKLHNLLSLAAKDAEIAPSPQDSGSHLILQHQKLMLDHFGHKHHAVLPEDVIQCLLLGVRILILFSLHVCHATYLFHFFIFLLISPFIFSVVQDIGVGPSPGIKGYHP